MGPAGWAPCGRAAVRVLGSSLQLGASASREFWMGVTVQNYPKRSREDLMKVHGDSWRCCLPNISCIKCTQQPPELWCPTALLSAMQWRI